MRFDLDLARQMLLKIEEMPKGATSKDLTVLGASHEKIQDHLSQLCAGNYLRLMDLGLTRDGYLITDITWAGHELIGAIRNDDVWRAVRSRGSDMTLQLAEQLANQELRRRLGLEPDMRVGGDPDRFSW